MTQWDGSVHSFAPLYYRSAPPPVLSLTNDLYRSTEQERVDSRTSFTFLLDQMCVVTE